MPHFFLKLNPPRPTFMHDMTDAEKAIMQQHVAYWKDLLDKGIVIVYGPVMDPAGGYGIGVVEVENEEQVNELTSHDPANGLNSYEIFCMRAITPKK